MMTKSRIPSCLAAATVAFIFAAPGAQAQEVVSILTTFGGAELDAYRKVTDRFTELTGNVVTIESTRDSISVLRIRVASGSPPDLALIAQPGVVAEYVRAGQLVPLVQADGSAGLLSSDVLTGNYSPGIVDLGTVDGVVYGILAKANSKSTVWYKPASFQELGIEPPRTWNELLAIQDKYVQAGKTPWSIGGSDAWTLTDWFENIYVRIAGPEMYRKLFVTHEVPWTDPTVVAAMNAFRRIIDPATNLAGGVDGTVSTGFISAANIVFRPKNPGAEMYYEGGFMGGIIANNIPSLEPVKDFNAFLFPQIDERWGAPVVGGGDLLVAFANRPEVAEFLRFSASAEANTIWAETGFIVSPNKNVDLSVYSPLGRIDAAQVVNAGIFVFDGSDLAPTALGSDALFIGLQDFVAEPERMMDVLTELENVAMRVY